MSNCFRYGERSVLTTSLRQLSQPPFQPLHYPIKRALHNPRAPTSNLRTRPHSSRLIPSRASNRQHQLSTLLRRPLGLIRRILNPLVQRLSHHFLYIFKAKGVKSEVQQAMCHCTVATIPDLAMTLHRNRKLIIPMTIRFRDRLNSHRKARGKLAYYKLQGKY